MVQTSHITFDAYKDRRLKPLIPGLGTLRQEDQELGLASATQRVRVQPGLAETLSQNLTRGCLCYTPCYSSILRLHGDLAVQVRMTHSMRLAQCQHCISQSVSPLLGDESGHYV